MRYYIVSDIHSFLSELLTGLKKNDFNPKEDTLVIDGDLFDRGDLSYDLLLYVKSIPHKVLIRGNHEYLLIDLLHKDEPEDYDFSNGTVFTVYQLYKARHPHTKLFTSAYEYANAWSDSPYGAMAMDGDFQVFNFIMRGQLSKRMWKTMTRDILKSGICEWIQGDEWVNYLEIKDYIITHSFIPIEVQDWRKDATPSQWKKAMWGCPYKQFDAGYFDEEIEKGKTLVCGHWYSNDFYKHYDRLSGVYEIYKRDNLIAIDSCTPLSHKINVLVIDDEED